MYLNEYISNKGVNAMDQLIIDMINKCKNE
jgi:hypothetical protein